MKRARKSTAESEIARVIAERGDLLTVSQLAEFTGLNRSHVISAIRNLRLRTAIDALIIDGIPYWFMTPDTDQRNRKIPERAIETTPRRKRRRKSIDPGSMPHFKGKS